MTENTTPESGGEGFDAWADKVEATPAEPELSPQDEADLAFLTTPVPDTEVRVPLSFAFSPVEIDMHDGSEPHLAVAMNIVSRPNGPTEFFEKTAYIWAPNDLESLVQGAVAIMARLRLQGQTEEAGE